ncbi:maleate cis-trans isomerase [Gordonia amicalis]|uniref:maleate cis-trans isomerase family protein n=1 Tax=Gordonia amicalis TaxID=89053 RepID=UPI0003FEA419|nr:maleate cis-trans isomerase [Gordonia amicalis]MCZ0914789.1 maleate cis-trans isomerase [Gordonia amicalis]MCZ4651480.1 maleate cis-trans isomerase [Gordonia amicalis]
MTTTIAMLYPGHAAEDDYELIESALVAADAAVRLPVTITEIESDDHTVDAMAAVGEQDRLAEGVRRALADQPASVMWACTSGSFVFGLDGARRQVADIAALADRPASSTSLAFVDACRHLGLSRVAIAATYPDPLASRFIGFLADGGIEVVSLRANDIETAAEAGILDGDGLFDMIEAADHPDAQAILIPDTALHTAMWITGLEEKFGKPVLTANQVTAWQGLRLAGMTTATTDLGTLFGR